MEPLVTSTAIAVQHVDRGRVTDPRHCNQGHFGPSTLLCDNAVLTGFFGASDARVVRRRPGTGEESFEHFLGALHAEFALAYSNFVHFVDLTEERCACTFRLEITPRDPHSTVGVRRLRNCNFFQFEAGRIAAITAYFASPAVDVDPWLACRFPLSNG